MTRHPLKVNDRMQRTYDRPRVTVAADPYEAAKVRCHRLTSAEDRIHFTEVFAAVRADEQAGVDTYDAYRWAEAYEDHVGIAAYIEAVASTRPAGWAQ